MKNDLLLDPDKFKIQLVISDKEKNDLYCKRLIGKWEPELESAKNASNSARNIPEKFFLKNFKKGVDK